MNRPMSMKDVVDFKIWGATMDVKVDEVLIEGRLGVQFRDIQTTDPVNVAIHLDMIRKTEMPDEREGLLG